MKGPAATWVGRDNEPGMGWLKPGEAAALTEPVVVLSKLRLPSELQPESAVAPATSPTIVAVLSALPETRLLISPLVRRYSMGMRLGR